MKLTKQHLRKLIEEELETALSEKAGAPDMAEVEDLAATFEKSPAIMRAIEQAMRDPKVQAALEKELAMQEGDDVYDQNRRDAYRKREKRYGAALIGLGGGTIGLGGTIAIMAPILASSAPIAALGITGGLALAAIGHIAANHFDLRRSQNQVKADTLDNDGEVDSTKDFPHWQHKKMRGSKP
jgi:hypothetical protein